jgi:LuxR family maltose regulon positive regulatory protein
MPEILLRTKLSVPPLRAGLVPRPHLIEHLDQGLQAGHKLTLISAPAGFGKTTLVCEWVASLRLDTVKESQITNRIAWLSLDEDDNDPTRFLAYFISALKQVQGIETTLGDAALNMLRSPQPPPTKVVLTSLINEVSDVQERIVFVLDDYHSIEYASSIDDAISFLLEHLPLQLHLVIATREDPNLQISRLRGRDQLTEVRAADLRFTSAEAAEFLNQVMGLDLSANDISTLETRTEGWIAGLQLAALSMQGHKDATSFIKSFTGSHRLVLDYLIEEVLEQQPESVQAFLLETSILNRLTGSLCDALTGQENSQETLEMLDRANLFIIPLDEQRHWYRYYHLFADLLRQRLHHTQPGQLPTLHQRASEWYEQNGFFDEAIEHTLRGDDFKKAAQLIEEQVDAISEHPKILRWLDELPVEVISSKPQLCIFRARHLFSNGQLEKAEQALQVAEHALDTKFIGQTGSKSIEQDQQSNAARNVIIGMTAVIRAFLAIYKGHIQETIDQSRKALDHLPEQNVTWRSAAALPFGDAIMFKGDIEASYDTRMETLEMSKKSGHPFLILVSNGRLAWTLRHQGKLKQVIELCEQQLQYANQFGLSNMSVSGWIMTLWGEALAEINEMAGAIQKANNGVELIGSGSGDLAVFGWGNLNLVRILFSNGDMVGAKEVIQRLENIIQDTHRLILNQIFAWKARIWLEENELEAASKWVEEFYLKANEKLNLLSEIECIVLTRTLIDQGSLDEATKLLQQLLNAAEVGKHTSRIIKILILQAMVFQAGDDTTQALVTLERALTLAKQEDFVRIFVDEGPPMARLLHDALSRGISPDYVRQLLGAFPLDESEQATSTKSKVDQSELIEPLSEREIEVLQLVAEGLTSREIAARLYLSPNTVKVHTRNINSKLGVNSRVKAVVKARTLGILPSM